MILIFPSFVITSPISVWILNTGQEDPLTMTSEYCVIAKSPANSVCELACLSRLSLRAFGLSIDVGVATGIMKV